MKFCPVCKTSYDEEVLRFCTKDGAPLVEDAQPNFTALPSREDLGEDTIIRRKTPPPIPSTAQPVPDFDDEEPERISSPRIVIPMGGEPLPDEDFDDQPARRQTGVRTMTAESVRRQPPPRESNTAMVVALTVLGTIVILGLGGGIVWFLSSQNPSSNQNANYNANFNSIDINLNTNLAVDNSLVNFNASLNSNANANSNGNLNANLKSPTPTPTKTPTPTPDANASINTNINGATNANANTPPPPSVTGTPFPRPSLRPSLTPNVRPSPNDQPTNRPAVNAGVLNSRAVNLPKPAYPPTAKQMNANGQVAVQVSVDEAGNVTAARATSGNPLLRSSAEAAARQSKFNPVRINNQAVPVNGIVLYNFVND